MYHIMRALTQLDIKLTYYFSSSISLTYYIWGVEMDFTTSKCRFDLAQYMYIYLYTNMHEICEQM